MKTSSANSKHADDHFITDKNKYTDEKYTTGIALDNLLHISLVL